MHNVRHYILQHKILTWTLLVIAALVVLLGHLLNSYYTQVQERYVQEHEETTRIMEALLNLETGSRGFVITGQSEFLDPFTLGQEQFPRSIRTVQRLILEGPRRNQQPRLRLLEDIEDVQKDWLAYALNLHQIRQVNFEQAQSIVKSNTGKRRMDQIRGRMGELQEVQRRLLQEARIKSRNTLLTVQIASLLGMVLAALSAFWQGTRLADRVTAAFRHMLQGSRAIASGNFTHRIPVDAPFLEARQVAEDFNQMAHQLLQTQTTLQESQTNLTHKNEDLEKLNGQITRLSGLSDQLQTCLNLSEAYHLLSFLLPEFLPGTSGEVMLFNASRNQLSRFMVWGEDPLSMDHNTLAPGDCLSLRIGQPYRVNEGRHTMPCPFMGETQSYQCIPMLAQGDTVGIFRMKSPVYSGEQNSLARLIAKQVSLAIANLQLREALRNQSIRDGLTHVYNRRYFEEVYGREVDRTRRHLNPLSLLMLDVDHFKRYNDTHGHEAGDAVLRAFGSLLQHTVRSSDVVCRYGGEEFVVLLPETDLETAVLVAEKVRLATEHMHPVTQDGLKLQQVTVSIGAATFHPDRGSAETLLAQADAALYQSKQAGRNRVTAASQEA